MGSDRIGRPEAAAAAVICYEWLQRPENVLAGVLRWPDYRSREWPSAIKILHHKTGAVVWHPLEETVNGAVVRFYPEAEAILATLPRRGVPMILREVKVRTGVVFKPFSYSGFEKVIQQLRKKIEGVPDHFTLDACRHGGMTELEEAALTEGQGRALSGIRRRKPIAATLKRHLIALSPRHANATLIGWRTNRLQTFGMKSGLEVGMKAKNQRRPVPSNCASSENTG